MAHRYLPVDRDQPAFLPLNMHDWVPKDHVVWLVIDTVEQLGTAELTARLAGGTRKSARGRRAYDPVMLLTLLAYAYCCGVLSTRVIEARCRVDATFRLACAGLVPDHSTISRFRQRACGEGGPMEDVFYAVLRVCAAAGYGPAERGGGGRGQDRGERVEGGEPGRGRRSCRSRRAAERGVSIAQVVRDALEQALGNDGQPIPQNLGKFSSRTTDTSERASNDVYAPPPWRW